MGMLSLARSRWSDLSQAQAWLLSPWSVQPSVTRWHVWQVLPVLVLGGWCGLRVVPLLWVPSLGPLPPTVSTWDAELAQKMAQSQAVQAAWLAALEMPPASAFQRLQTLAGAAGLQAIESPAEASAPVRSFPQRELAWVGRWEAVHRYLSDMPQQVPSLWVHRLNLSARPGGGIALRLQVDTTPPVMSWPETTVQSSQVAVPDPFDDSALTRRLVRQADERPPGPRPRVTPLQAADPQALRLLGVGRFDQGPQAVLAHQGQVYLVQSGDGVGWHHGRVTLVREDHLEIQEHVRGPGDAWQTRWRRLHFSGQSVRP